MVLKISFEGDSKLNYSDFGEVFRHLSDVRPMKGDTLVSEDGEKFYVKESTVSTCVNSQGHEDVLIEYVLSPAGDGTDLQAETKSIIVLGFPAVGKTHFTKKFESEFSISDADVPLNSRDKNFNRKYVSFIKKMCRSDINYIFTSVDGDLIDRIKSDDFFKDVPKYIIYPSRELKADYIERFRDRGNNQEYVSYMSDNWDAIIDKIESETEDNRFIPFELKSKNDYIELFMSIFDIKVAEKLLKISPIDKIS